jgi:prephenate dehydratase
MTTGWEATTLTSDAAARVGFLGPEGTFTEEALLANMPPGKLFPYPYSSVREVMAAVHDGTAALGLVPIENSLEGSVAVTLDLLAFSDYDVKIVREVTHAIRHQLIARAPIELSRITKILSHPHAYGQCRTFLDEHLPGVEHEAANSTAEAVRRVSRVDRPWAAIGNRLAAEMYECIIAQPDIEDSVDNRTRFVFLARQPADQSLDAPYKTSIVCGIAQDEPGSLLLILSELAYRHINLSKVESRPSKLALGHYIFFIDLEGKQDDPAVAQAIKCLTCKLPWLRVLGSYPA